MVRILPPHMFVKKKYLFCIKNENDWNNELKSGSSLVKLMGFFRKRKEVRFERKEKGIT